MSERQWFPGRFSSAVRGTLLTFLVVAALAGFLSLFLGIAVLRVAREQSAGIPKAPLH